MSDAVIERMRDPDHARLLKFILHTLEADSAARATPDPIDVERLFAAVALLIDRHEQPWSPFVATWSPALESFFVPHALSPRHELSQLERVLKSRFDAIERAIQQNRGRAGFGLSGGISGHGDLREVANSIEKYVKAEIRRSRSGDVRQALLRVRREMLVSLFDLLYIRDASQVEYLAPLMELANDQHSLTVATLNYDRSIEECADGKGVGCDTGIETWLASGELDWTAKGIRLLKLHGSIDWVLAERVRESGLPVQRFRKIDQMDQTSREEQPAVVFGEIGKLQAEGPYLELLLAWSSHLRSADNLLVVGYSWRDQHVNEVIARWFSADDTRRIVLLTRSDPGQAPRDSFARNLPRINEAARGHDAPTTARFVHVQGKTSERLAAAIEEAQILGEPEPRGSAGPTPAT